MCSMQLQKPRMLLPAVRRFRIEWFLPSVVFPAQALCCPEKVTTRTRKSLLHLACMPRRLTNAVPFGSDSVFEAAQSVHRAEINGRPFGAGFFQTFPGFCTRTTPPRSRFLTLYKAASA